MAKLGKVINVQDRARNRKHRCHVKSLAAIILCVQIVSYGCAPEPSGKLGWASSPEQPEPSHFDYLPERGDRIIPLVVQRLRQSTDQGSLDALGCMARNPIDKVTLGTSESPELRDLLAQVLVEFKTKRQMCLPLSGGWQAIALCRAHDCSGGWSIGPQTAGVSLMAASVYYASCYMSVGFVCPVVKNFDIEFVIDVVLPDGHKSALAGVGHSSEWSVTAWNYKAVRDESFAEVVSEALMSLAIQYSGMAAERLLELSEGD